MSRRNNHSNKLRINCTKGNVALTFLKKGNTQMSMKLNAGEIVRQDVFLIDPANIVVVEEKNTRWQPHDDAEIAALAKSFEQEGQLQPVVVRRIADNRVQLVAGYRRYHAAQQFNLLHPDQPMKLKCVVSMMNDEEALRRSIVENRERAQTTAMDDAHNQRRLREECGWTDVRIAEFYKVSPPYVGTLKKLLLLPTDIQMRVHHREISVQAALALTDLSPEDQKAVLAPETPASVTVPEATDTGATPVPVVPAVTSAEIIKRTREKKIQHGKKQARTLKEVKDFLEGLPAEVPNVKAFAETFLKFISGAYTDQTMERKLKAFVVGVPEPETPAGLEATLVPEVPSVVETPVDLATGTLTAFPEVIQFPIETEVAVPEIVPFPVETVETPFPVVEAA